MIRTPGPARVPGTPDHFVGPFHSLDGDDGLMLDGDRLSDVEPGDDVGHAIAELEVLSLVVGRRALRQHARPCQQRRQERRRVDQLDPVVLHDGRDGSNQAIGVSRGQLLERRDEREIRDDAAEDLRMLDLPRHDGSGRASLAQEANARSQLTERDPVNRGAVPLGSVIELGERLFLHSRRW
jgi:hypothetical protein